MVLGGNDRGDLGVGDTNKRTSPTQLTMLGTSVVQVSAGNKHTCARKNDGTLWCWGYNYSGQLGIGTSGVDQDGLWPARVTAMGRSSTAVSAGSNHACTLGYGWGRNANGHLGDGTNVNKSSPVGVSSSPVEMVAGGGNTGARKPDKSLWCWGATTLARSAMARRASRCCPSLFRSGVPDCRP